ncbi:phosphoheptose isomerase [Subtercola sp. Z020]|uniref:D-sedoheptulose-7-phosphate isomerase n=1 Tax=Subtercola sp. Z020 TaxID=2080582 RepID=UPI000CE8DB6A|nr:SIS domain-containing protein [Subtercola sp. Z020]PPF87836.1 phosphoheptose isomerase [Subtercola sp. Z020]
MTLSTATTATTATAATATTATGRTAPRDSPQNAERQAARSAVDLHLDSLAPTLSALQENAAVLSAWGCELAERLMAGGRLLTAGNGGSAAEAQHLSAELVGRFDGDRRPFSAIALHADTSSVTAIANDYGFDQVYARQVAGHGRPGDVLMLLSTSGSSANLLAAAATARRLGLTTWALTGRGPNPLCEACDEHIALPGPSANVQEAQLIALHAVCRAFDHTVRARDAGPRRLS